MSRGEGAVLKRARRIAPIGAALLLVVLAASALAAVAKPAVVTTHQTKRGKVLAAANGHTLYLSTADGTSKSNCYGGCAKTWTPLLTGGRPTAAKGSGVNAKLLGATRRTNHTLQVTYKDHPLYTYGGDKAAGQTKGEAVKSFGGRWYVVNIAGNAVKPPNSGGCPPHFVKGPTGCIPSQY